MSDDSQPNPLRDDTYFLEPVFFKVEGTIFQVPKHLFSEIEVFSTTFTLPPTEGVDVDGSSEGHPFELLGVLKEDFRAFLQAIYPFGQQTHASMTIKQWVSVLKLSDMWAFETAKMLAVKMIKASNAIDDPIQKWVLGERYNVPIWVIEGCLELIMRNEDGPQLDEVEKLGLPKALLVYKLREMRLKLHINTLAARPSSRISAIGIRSRIREEVRRMLGVSEDGDIQYA